MRERFDRIAGQKLVLGLPRPSTAGKQYGASSTGVRAVTQRQPIGWIFEQWTSDPFGTILRNISDLRPESDQSLGVTDHLFHEPTGGLKTSLTLFVFPEVFV